MAIVTIRAVQCQMLRVIPIQVDDDDPNQRLYAGYCRCGARFLADSRDEAVEAVKEHRFHDGALGTRAVWIEGSWQS